MAKNVFIHIFVLQWRSFSYWLLYRHAHTVYKEKKSDYVSSFRLEFRKERMSSAPCRDFRSVSLTIIMENEGIVVIIVTKLDSLGVVFPSASRLHGWLLVLLWNSTCAFAGIAVEIVESTLLTYKQVYQIHICNIHSVLLVHLQLWYIMLILNTFLGCHKTKKEKKKFGSPGSLFNKSFLFTKKLFMSTFMDMYWWKFVWTSRGRVFARKNEDYPVIHIANMPYLAQMHGL